MMNTVDYIKDFPIRRFSRGAVLIQRGDPLNFLMAIREGYVKVTSISDAGIERMLWIAGRYDFAPVEQLFTKHSTSRFFYTALTDGSYYEVNRIDLIAHANEHPIMMTEIARGMSEHYDDFLQRVDAVDSPTVSERLLRTLHYLAQRFSAGASVDLYAQGLHVTHQDLAAMIGSTRETTSVVLSKLRTSGFVEYDRRSFVVNVRKIESILE